MPSLSVFIQLMFHSICGPICKHFELFLILKAVSSKNQNKVANQQMHSNLPQIKKGETKKQQKTHKKMKQKEKIALQKFTNIFSIFFSNVYLSGCHD